MVNENINIDDIKVVTGANKLDKTKYEGFRIQIAKVSPEHIQDQFPKGVDGQPAVYTPNSTAMKWVIRIETAPLPELDADGKATAKLIEFPQKDGTMKNFTITHDFNLQEEFNPETKQMEVAISKHPKAKLWAFMRKMGAQKVSELNKKLVTLTAQPSKKEGDDRIFLSIVV